MYRKNKLNFLIKSILAVAVLGVTGVTLQGILTAFVNYDQSGEKCPVTPNQIVVKWKGLADPFCSNSIAGICIWPIHHIHQTYKVFVPSGTPLRDGKGQVISATNGHMRIGWLVYDADAWNRLSRLPAGKRYTDYEPIAPNEYVVMVETRYRLLNNVETTLGICMQQP